MSSTLRDELASLRIERFERGKPKSNAGPRPRHTNGRGEGGLGLLSLLVWLVPLVALSGAAAIAYKQFDALKPKIEVTVAQVQLMTTGEKEKVLSAKGYVKSRQIAMIGSKKTGRIAEIRFEEGRTVKRGDVLAVLEHDDLVAELESRQATIERTESEMVEAAADLVEKDGKIKRSSRLAGQKQISYDEYETALAAFRKAKARVEALRSATKLMKAMARQTEETIEDMTIVAPFDGTILTKEAEIGDTVNAGPADTGGRGTIATLADSEAARG